MHSFPHNFSNKCATEKMVSMQIVVMVMIVVVYSAAVGVSMVDMGLVMLQNKRIPQDYINFRITVNKACKYCYLSIKYQI